jgi:hypothetical protein
MIKLLFQSTLCFIVPILSFFYTILAKPKKGSLFNNNDYKQSRLVTTSWSQLADLKTNNYNVLFTMCCKEIESGHLKLYHQLKKRTENTLMILLFDRQLAYYEKRIDSQQNAKLVFITANIKPKEKEARFRQQVLEQLYRASN